MSADEGCQGSHGFEISIQQPAFCNEDLQWLDINIEDVNLRFSSRGAAQ
jgi:hypothetical protein